MARTPICSMGGPGHTLWGRGPMFSPWLPQGTEPHVCLHPLPRMLRATRQGDGSTGEAHGAPSTGRGVAGIALLGSGLDHWGAARGGGAGPWAAGGHGAGQGPWDRGGHQPRLTSTGEECQQGAPRAWGGAGMVGILTGGQRGRRPAWVPELPPPAARGDWSN